MNPRATAILLAITVALGAFVLFYELREDRDSGGPGPEVGRIFADPSLDPDMVESLSFTTEEGTPARIERREGRWWVVEPVDAPADQAEVDGMVSTLVHLSSEGVIEEPQKASVYGLDDATRSFRFRAGGREYGVQIGAKTPVGPNSYVSSTTSNRVFIVPTWKVSSLAHTLLELRDRRVIPFDPNAVARVVATWPGGGVTVERERGVKEREGADLEGGGEGTWQVVSPARWRADDAVIETLLSDFSFLRADSFVDEQIVDAEAGLDEPAFDVWLEFDPDTASQGEADADTGLRFSLGSFVGGSDRIARGPSGARFRVPLETLADFPRRGVAYRYKQLASFEPSEAHSIDLIFNPPGSGGAITLSMRRSQEGWTATSGEALAAGRASRLLAELARLKAVGIVAESMGPRELAELGLLPARAAFRVFGSPGEEGEANLLCEIRIGDSNASEGILAKAIGNDTVYRLDYALSDDIPVNYGVFVESFATKTEREVDEGAEAEAAPDPP